MLALIIWEHDRPITGNIIKMESIVSPRKAIADYFEGERVRARCKGFGTPDGVIGKIVEENQRKELEDILRGNGFEALVQKILHSDDTSEVEETLPPVPLENEPHTVESGGVEKITLHRPKARKPSAKKPPQEKKRKEEDIKKATEAAAAELELTELHRDVELHQQANEARGEESTTSCLLKRGLDSLIEDVVMEDESSHKVPRIDNGSTSCNCIGRIQSLEQEVWHLNQKIHSQESNLAWLWNQVQQLQQAQTTVGILSHTASSSVSHSGQAASSVTGQSPSAVDTPEETNPSDTADENETVGGFTESQLEWKASHCTTYAKMSAVLFGTLFKEEEYLGRTLTGGGNKPQIDPVKMQVIYRVVAKRFKDVTPVMIREKLRDLVKPYRVLKNKMSKST